MGNGGDYEGRRLNLAAMGFETYEAYLDSTLWKAIRQSVLRRDRGKCVLCKDPAEQVHHLDYRLSVLKGGNNRRLVSLCGRCHIEVEFDLGRKRTFRQSREVFALLLSHREKKVRRKYGAGLPKIKPDSINRRKSIDREQRLFDLARLEDIRMRATAIRRERKERSAESRRELKRRGIR